MTGRLQGDIAIIGMSCLYPGAGSVRQFWENILNKFDAISEAPEDWHPELFFDAESGADDRSYTKRGGFLKELAEFDPLEFGVMPHSIDGSAPDHFLSIRMASEALADAGYADPERLRAFQERTAVILGHGEYIHRAHGAMIQRWVTIDAAIRVLRQLHPEHSEEELALVRRELAASLPVLNTDNLPGLVPNIVSGRIANRLNLMGGTFNVDGACASSLLAIDIACRELLSGRCDMVLAGGVHASSTTPIWIIFSQLKGLSRKGQIRPFDSGADGTLLSEGAAFLALKRPEDAERDKDRIYAIIKGVGISSDGRAMGLLTPRLEGEELAIRRAYEASGVDPASVELIEGHGTATVVGDATELEALNHTFGARTGNLARCALGSVKSMIGHSIPASGMASAIKMALSLHHKVLPPTINCDTPNPKLQAETSNLYINTETRPWIHGPAETPRRAAVNAFGFGGVNSHMVLEEYTPKAPATLLHQRWDSELFVFSAPDTAGLVAETRKLGKVIEHFGPELCLKDLAWSLNTKPFASARLAIVATSVEDLVGKLARAADRLADQNLRQIRDKEGIFYFRQPLAAGGKLAFVFPGEGAQYMNMLADLALHFPEVREVFDLMDRAYLDHPRGYLPSELLVPAAGQASEHLWSMDVGAEAVFSANEAMLRLLTNLGVLPGMMMGHSTGEYNALIGTGALQMADEVELMSRVRAVNAVFEKLKASNQIPERTLLAIGGADRARLQAMVAASQDQLYLAIDNCPNQVVLCGDPGAIEGVVRELSSTPAVCQTLPFSRAYHSPWFQIFTEHLRGFFDSMNVCEPHLPLYSCVTAERLPSDPSEIRQTAASGWSRTVRFRETIERMYQDGARMFVEVGPRGNLKSFIDDILRGKPYWASASNLQHRSGILQLHHLLGQLAAHGVPLTLQHLYSRRDPRPLEIPVKGRPKRRLRLGIEPMTLPADFKLPPRKAPVTPPAPQTKVNPAATVPSSPAKVLNGHGSVRAAEAPSRVTAPIPVPTAPVQVTPVPVMAAQPAAGSRAAVLQQHFATMQQFLQVQQQVMGAAVAGRAMAPYSPVPISAPLAPEPETPQRRLPLISEVVELIPGVRARSLYRVQPEPVYDHHALGQDVSAEDASLNGLPIIPLAFSVEIMAEAASVLEPGKVVVEIRNMRSQRWVMLVPPLPVLEMTAEQVEPGVVHVKMREAAAGKLIRPVWMEATVVFADQYPSAVAPLHFDTRGLKPSKWEKGTLYPWGMFHGPRLQGIEQVDQTGDSFVVSTMKALPHRGLLSEHDDARFVVDPVMIDVASQLVSFWSQEQLDPYCDTFPYRFERLQCFAPIPPAGARIEGRMIIREITPRDIHCDLDILDSSGAVLFRVYDWNDRRFDQPAAVWHFRVSPREASLSREAPELVDHNDVDQNDQVCCSIVDSFEPELMESSFGVFGEMLAGLILSRSERDVWRGMNTSERGEWLCGRCAAKDSVRTLIKRKFGTSLYPADITIVAGTQGRFRAMGGWSAALGVSPVVSITTARGVAAAAASLDPSQSTAIHPERIGKLRSPANTIIS